MKRVLFSLISSLFAFLILFVSIFRVAAVKYDFCNVNNDSKVLGSESLEIDYQLAYPGKILPDSAIWPLKAVRDRVWLLITTENSKKSELKLLFADKRLGSAKILFEKNKPEAAYTTLTKAEKYLESASLMEEVNRKAGIDTREFSKRLTLASLKHYQLMQNLVNMAPDDAKPKIIELLNYPKSVYERSRNAMLEKGLGSPINPFGW